MKNCFVLHGCGKVLSWAIPILEPTDLTIKVRLSPHGTLPPVSYGLLTRSFGTLVILPLVITVVTLRTSREGRRPVATAAPLGLEHLLVITMAPVVPHHPIIPWRRRTDPWPALPPPSRTMNSRAPSMNGSPTFLLSRPTAWVIAWVTSHQQCPYSPTCQHVHESC